MDRIKICSDLIKLANILDKDGHIELANELTFTAENIANKVVISQAQPVPAAPQTPVVQPAQQFQPTNVDPRYDYLKRAIESGNVDYVGQALNYFGGFAAREYNRFNQYKSAVSNYQTKVMNEASKIYNQYANRNKLPQVVVPGTTPNQPQTPQTAPAATAPAQTTAQPAAPVAPRM